MKYAKCILSFSLTFLCISAFIFLKQIHAQGTNLTVSPSLIRIEAKPPADIWTPFTIKNNGAQPISLKIGYKAFDPQASSNGNVVFLPDGQTTTGEDKKIFEKMQIVDDQNISHDSIDIGPQQQLRFRLRITLPPNEPTSDYYFSLIFLEKPGPIDQSALKTNNKDHNSFSTLQAGIGFNVLMAVGEKKTPEGMITNFHVPWFLNSGPVPFSLSVYDTGEHFINPQGEILIKNIFGQTIGKVEVPSTIVLAGTQRDFTSDDMVSSANKSMNKAQNNGSFLVWPEKFLLGAYTATLTLKLSSQGPIYVRTIHFISFPVIFFLESLAIILLITAIYLRVKKKLA